MILIVVLVTPFVFVVCLPQLLVEDLVFLPFARRVSTRRH